MREKENITFTITKDTDENKCNARDYNVIGSSIYWAKRKRDTNKAIWKTRTIFYI